MTEATPRLNWLDAARGAAVLGMIAYHGAFDAAALGLSDADVVGSPWWTALARLTAGSFLFLVGVSLVCAARGGMNWRAYGRRLFWLVLAASVITASTLIAVRLGMMPDAPILFGILHAIAAASVFGLALSKAPAWACAIIGVVVFGLPQLGLLDLSQPWLQWLGLRLVPPASYDYVPLFPWFGCTALGMAFAKAVPLTRSGPRLPALQWLGRHALPIYLVHQPVLIGLMAAYGWVVR